MKISEVIPTLKAELGFSRTPSGRSISDYGLEGVRTTLEDSKNWHVDAIKCLNCCIILSSLIVPKGCINCGGQDLTLDIGASDIWLDKSFEGGNENESERQLG